MDAPILGSSPSPPPRTRRSFARRCERSCWTFITYIPLAFVYGLTTWAVWVQAKIGFQTSGSTWTGRKTIRTKEKAILKLLLGPGSAFLGIILYTLLNWSYTTAVFTDPGSTLSTSSTHPYTALPTSEDNNHNKLTSLTANSRGEVRFCKKCQTRKPDRSHHCSTCRRCVLKMDHHCPWLATCVGFRNYKPFLLFLIYVCLFCYVCFAVSLTWVMKEVFTDVGPYDESWNVVHNILLAVVSGIFGLVLSGFTGWHIYLTLNNLTTIESMEKTRYMHPSKNPQNSQNYVNSDNTNSTAQLTDQFIQAPGITRPEEGEALYPAPSPPPHTSPAQQSLRTSYASLERQREHARYNAYLDERDSESLPHAFNLGWRRNLAAIFGPSPMLWWLPVCNSPGDGWIWEASQKWEKASEELAVERAARERKETAWARADEDSMRWDREQARRPAPPPPRSGAPRADRESQRVKASGGSDTRKDTANWNDIPEDFLDPRRPDERAAARNQLIDRPG